MPSPGFSVENGVVKSTTGISEKWTFTDDFYDGIRETNRFHGGLGQLTDGIIGTKDLTEVCEIFIAFLLIYHLYIFNCVALACRTKGNTFSRQIRPFFTRTLIKIINNSVFSFH